MKSIDLVDPTDRHAHDNDWQRALNADIHLGDFVRTA